MLILGLERWLKARLTTKKRLIFISKILWLLWINKNFSIIDFFAAKWCCHLSPNLIIVCLRRLILFLLQIPKLFIFWSSSLLGRIARSLDTLRLCCSCPSNYSLQGNCGCPIKISITLTFKLRIFTPVFLLPPHSGSDPPRSGSRTNSSVRKMVSYLWRYELLLSLHLWRVLDL